MIAFAGAIVAFALVRQEAGHRGGAGGAGCVSATAKPRLPAAERRQAIVDAALRVFAAGSYSGATTAEIAREAGISEPILYRHFASKRELYLACLESAWASFRAALEAKLDERGDREAIIAIGEAVARVPRLRRRQAGRRSGSRRSPRPARTSEIRGFLRGQLRDVHDYIAGTRPPRPGRRRCPADRDPDAEAWIFVGAGLLLSFADRLGGLLGRGRLRPHGRRTPPLAHRHRLKQRTTRPRA